MIAQQIRVIASTVLITVLLPTSGGCGSAAGTAETAPDTEVTVEDTSTAPDVIEDPVIDVAEPPADTAPVGAGDAEIEDTPEPVGEVSAPECQVNADCEHLAADMPCHVAVCEFGDCLTVQLSDGTACDDGNPCTVDSLCAEGACHGTEDLTGEGCAGVAACETATVIDTIPFTHAATTIGGTGYYASTDCPGPAEGKGASSNDALYVMDVAESGTYVFTLTDLEEDPEGLDAVLYLVEGCPGLGTSTCIAAQDIWYKHGKEEITVSLQAGAQLFVVVDGYAWDTNIEGNFELVVTMKKPPETDCSDGEDNDSDGAADCADLGCVEAPECLAVVPGALCSNPIVIDSVPFLHEGTTVDMGNEVHIADETCPDAGDLETPIGMFGMASDDVFFAFTPGADGTYVISLDTEEDEDNYENLVMALYEGDCPSGIATDICVMGDNAANDGGELLVAELIGGTPYFIVLDGWGNDFDIHGGYALRVDELANVPSGALAITELMGNPEGGIADGDAEWIELRNATEQEQPLKGLALTYRSWNKGDEMPAEPANTWVITEDFAVSAGATTVIAKSADTSVNGGLFVGVEYGSISLSNNGAKFIALQLVKASWNGEGDPPEQLIIDELTIPAGTFFGPGKGASFQLDEGRAAGPDPAAANDWSYRWCHTPEEPDFVYFTDNYGTPQQANGTCEGADGPPPMSFEDDIKPIYVLRCIGCHTGGGGCLGGGCWDNYDALLLDSYYCFGLTKGECTAVRIHEGSMPQGTGCTGDPEADQDNAACLTADEQQYLDWWIEGGMQP